MRPVLLSNTPTGDGRAVLVWSVSPGRRVSVIAGSTVVTDRDLADMVAVIIPALQARSTK